MKPTPRTPEDFNDLYARSGRIFQPATPIAKRELFAGRIVQIARVADAVAQPGLHVAIYGERGVGKTSLANILSEIELNQGITGIRINCDSTDTFGSVWDKLSERLAPTRTGFGAPEAGSARALFEDVLVPDEVVRGLLQLENPILCIFDEFDRLPKAEARIFSDLIKSLSDNAVRSTVALVGVAETVTDLVEGHASVERSLVQIEMPRMQDSELAEILDKAANQLGITFSSHARDTIVMLSQGLPHYTHLIGRESVRAAASEGQAVVGVRHVRMGVASSVQDVQETTREQYSKAVFSSQSDALYRQVLLACALARKGARANFRPIDAARAMSKLMGRKYEIPAIARHLKSFSEDDSRGHILNRSGRARNFTYRFANPLMETFVLMRGLADGLFEPALIAEIRTDS